MSKSFLQIRIILFGVMIAFSIDASAQALINVQATYSGSTTSIKDYWGINGTDVTDPGLGWDNDSLPKSIKDLKSSTIRYPGGTKANWWDWKTGGYVDGTKISIGSCFGLPTEFGAIFSPNNNTLEKFKLSINSSGARPVFVLNLLSATLPDQLAMLQEAQIQGFGLSEIEMGNEFYLDQCEYKSAFPNATTYGEKAGLWSQEIRKRFSGLSISFLAALSGVNSIPRQKNWNTELLSAINNAPLDAKPDAYILHQYKVTGLGTKTSCTSINYTDLYKSTCTAKKWQTFFYSASQALDLIELDEMVTLTQNYNKPFWFTEYNLSDHDYYIHGTWAHALHTSAMTLAYLAKSSINHVNCHTMFGNAVFGSIFSDVNGFKYSANTDNPFCIVTPPVNILTGAFTRTGVGFALSEIGSAMKHGLAAKNISFSGTTQKLFNCNNGSATKESLQGWSIIDTTGNEQLIILNLSNDTISLSFSAIGNQIPAPSAYVSYAFDLNAYIFNSDSNGTIQYTNFDPIVQTYSAPYTTTITPVLFDSTATLSPFSITRMWKYDPSLITVVAQKNVVCEGNSVILQAVADPTFTDYQWYHNGIAISEATSSTVIIIPDSAINNNYTVSAKNSGGITITSPPSIITVHEKPVVDILADSVLNICKGSSVSLKGVASNNNNSTFYYTWFPDKQITGGNALSDSIQITPDDSIEYVLYASDGVCAGKSLPIKINILGDINLDLFESICDTIPNGNIPLTLPNTPAGITASYLWNTGATTQSIYLPTGYEPDYAVTVTYYNQSNQQVCSTQDETKVHLAGCCNSTYNLGTNKNARDLINYLHTICNTCVFDTSKFKTTINGINLGSPRPPIALSGVFTVNEDLQLKNFVFEMAEGARIEIAAYHTLTLEGTKLQSCTNGKMWQGIYVSKFGNVIVRSLSNIESARHAIETEDFTSLKVINSTLKNNYIGIYYNGPGMNTTGTYTLATFYNDTVPLKLKYNWMPETPGLKGLAGIWINNPAALVGNAAMKVTSNTATFNNLTNSIVINGSIGDRKDALNSILARPASPSSESINPSVTGIEEDH